ncbi:MAG: ribose transport system substrate-binding protein [Flavobacteriales bacterium]|jgi:ribose transport system substrate-binding protein
MISKMKWTVGTLQVLGLCATVLSGLSFAEQEIIEVKHYRFALIGKDQRQFFTRAHLGCKEAELELDNVLCEFHSPQHNDVIEQDRLIRHVLNSGVDGIALSVIQSSYLAENSLQMAKEMGIPIITFDSDLNIPARKIYQGLRLAYVGTNNESYGRLFAKALKKLHPNGATVCLQTGRPDSPNLMSRLKGFRAELSGDEGTRAPGKKLIGVNRWFEHGRCPLYSYEDPEIALNQLSLVISRDIQDIDAIVSFGGWAQFFPNSYDEAITPYQKKRRKHNVSLIFADALYFQLRLLEEGLTDVNISQSPYEMGRQAIHTLNKIVQKEEFEEFQYTPISICTMDEKITCIKD